MSDLNKILTTIAPDRREFVKKFLSAAGFAVPVICSFSMAQAINSVTTGIPTTVTTSVPTTNTTAIPTTTPAPTTTSCLGGIGPNGCWPDAE